MTDCAIVQTALSGEHNLFFVACSSDIYVYVPHFPSQALSEPVLIVPSQPSSPGLTGYLDSLHSHSINGILVALLGREEVVATVRDDGDVEVVLVRHIVQAIRQRGRRGNTIGKVADEIKQVFQSNVGISAWGLAVHSNARIIAVSSNKHEVTVFRFALLDEYEAGEDTAGGAWDSPQKDDVEAGRSQAASHRQRKTDVTHQVLNGEANIPYVAFCNTGDDPEARWLLTTDINGFCRTIDLHRVVPVSTFRFGYQIESIYGGSYDRMNAGWTIMFLDNRSFAPETSFHRALHLSENETLPDAINSPHIWDLSRTIRNVPEVSHSFVQRPLAAASQSRSRVRSPQSPQSTVEQSHIHPSPSSQLQDADPVALEVEEQSVGEDGDDDVDGPTTIGLNETVDEYDDVDDESAEETAPSSAFSGGERICGNTPRFNRSIALCDDLPCPILHTSIRNIYMLQPTNFSTHEAPFHPPLVGLAAPLKQSVQLEYQKLNMFDRLNMSGYIPALGVVVLASQKGRAIVLGLTKLSRAVSYPPEMRGVDGKTNYAMRVEAILPLASQERQNQRPFAPLHGIAVGPMQGTEHLPEGKKRWRLMMMYQDHAILSYEIARKGGRDSGVDIGSLVI